MVLFYLPVALGSLLYLFYAGGEYTLVVRTIGERPERDVLLGLAFGSVVVIAGQVLATRLATTRRMVAAFERSIGQPSWAMCLLIAGSAGAGEELLFRAVLQEVLGWPAATALFLVAYLPLERDLWPWPLVALPVGLGLAGLYAYTGATLAPFAAHVVIHFVSLRWISFRSAARGARRAPGSAT